MVRKIKGLMFRESQFIEPGGVHRICYDSEVQNKTDLELAIRIAPNNEHESLEDAFGKMSITVLQIYEEAHEGIRELKEQVLFLQATVKAQADFIEKLQSLATTAKRESE